MPWSLYDTMCSLSKRICATMREFWLYMTGVLANSSQIEAASESGGKVAARWYTPYRPYTLQSANWTFRSLSIHQIYEQLVGALKLAL